MKPAENKFNAIIQGSDITRLMLRGEDPNKYIPFMAMNRAARRAAIKEAKKLAKKLLK